MIGTRQPNIIESIVGASQFQSQVNANGETRETDSCMMIGEQPDVERRIHDFNCNRTSFVSTRIMPMLVRVLPRATRTRDLVLSLYDKLGLLTPQTASRRGRLWRLGADNGA